MSINQVINLLLRNWLILILFPLMLAGAVFYFSQNEVREYESGALLYTSLGGSRTGSVGESVRMDYYTSNNMFDNMVILIRSRETIEKASLKLMALHMSLDQPDSTVISKGNYQYLRSQIPEGIWQQIAVPGDPEKTYDNLVEERKENDLLFVDQMLRDSENYGIFNILNRLRANRRASSDMMELVYRANDPGICQYTLIYIIEVFMDKYALLKEEENINAIKYFENQLEIAKGKLDDAEARLKGFISQNNILNFYEQGKYLDIALLEQERDEELASRLKAGTESNLEQIEELFDMFNTRSQVLDELIGLQRLLISKSNELESLRLQPSPNAERIRYLRNDIAEVQSEIDTRSNQVFEVTNTKEGVSRETILDEWLKLKVEYENQVQSLEVMKERRQSLSRRISAFAPLGAELNKLEREVTVNEGQYLSILHGLNMAYLKKYDLEMSTNQQVIDKPFYPLAPLTSKRKLLVIGAFMAGFLLIVSIIIGTRLLDPKIRTLERALETTGLNAAGTFPDTKKLKSNVDAELLMDGLTGQIIGQLKYKLTVAYTDMERATYITLFSHHQGEGKNFVVKQLVKKLDELSYRNLVISYKDNDKYESEKTDWLKISDNFNILKARNISELINNNDKSPENYDNIILVLDSFNRSSVPTHIIKKSDVSLLVINANRKWNGLDKRLLSNYDNIEIPAPIFVLNKMSLIDMEQGYGSIPKKKGWFKKS